MCFMLADSWSYLSSIAIMSYTFMTTFSFNDLNWLTSYCALTEQISIPRSFHSRKWILRKIFILWNAKWVTLVIGHKFGLIEVPARLINETFYRLYLLTYLQQILGSQSITYVQS